jgi:hypothetical protein
MRLDTFTGVDPSGCFPIFAIASSATVWDVAANAWAVLVMFSSSLFSLLLSSLSDVSSFHGGGDSWLVALSLSLSLLLLWKWWIRRLLA